MAHDERIAAQARQIAANRNRIIRWLANWHFPEVTWPREIPQLPLPYVGGTAAQHLAAPLLETHWLLTAHPLIDDIAEAYALWRFHNNQWTELQIRITISADPDYIAETFVGAMIASEIDTFSDIANDRDGVQYFYDWIGEGVYTAVDSGAARGSARHDRTLLVFECLASYRYEQKVAATLTMTPTDQTLDGVPLSSLPEYGD